MNAYEILKLQPGASPAQVRSAYWALARRWHPDRFMAGPEREWATAKMAQINSAYRECLKGASSASRSSGEAEQLKKIEDMIQRGALKDARSMLMAFTTRSAEWNYLFGAVLYRLCEYDKALKFLSVAAHQNPANEKYLRAERAARDISGSHTGKLRTLVKGFRN